MSERNELTDIIASNRNEYADKTAGRVLAAGYRKPYMVTTAEERAALLPGTIAMDAHGNAWKRGSGSWVGTGEGGALYDDMDLALTVLHVGGAE